jgi:hypothetical protein
MNKLTNSSLNNWNNDDGSMCKEIKQTLDNGVLIKNIGFEYNVYKSKICD